MEWSEENIDRAIVALTRKARLLVELGGDSIEDVVTMVVVDTVLLSKDSLLLEQFEESRCWGVMMKDNPRPLKFHTREEAMDNLDYRGDRLVTLNDSGEWVTPNMPCFYTERWSGDAVGPVDVCALHAQNSRHPATDGAVRPCLAVDPYPETRNKFFRRSK